MATEVEIPERVKERLRGCQWVIQDLRSWRRKLGGASSEAPSDGAAQQDAAERWVERKTLVRKCEWPERADAAAAVAFLSREECLAYLRLCREELGGTDWAPRFAWFEQDDVYRSRPRGGWLYHALRLRDSKGGVDGPYVLEDGCKRRVEATFYWGVREVPECPPSVSGVHYELTVRGYSDEAGEYDCVLTKTVTVEQDVPPYDSHRELGETRRTAELFGVSDEGEGKDVDAKVAAFAAANGLSLEDGAVGEGDGMEGRVVDVRKVKNPDCTTDVTVVNTEEERVPRRTVEGEETARGKVRRVLDEHVAPEAGEDGADYPLAPPSNGKLVSKRVTKTPGGVRNVEVTERESKAVAAGAGNAECSRTVFEHLHTEVSENLRDEPSAEASDAGIGTDGMGRHYRRRRTLNDDGTWSSENSETVELPVPEARTTATEERFERVLDVTDANAAKADAAPGFSVGKLVEQTAQKNPGGSITNRRVERTAKDGDVSVTFRTRDGVTRRYGWFRNKTLEQARALIAQATSGNVQINAFGLFDGTWGDVMGDGGRQVSSGRKYAPFDEGDTVKHGDLFVVGGKVYRKDVTMEYVEGIVHDSDPTGDSKTSAYAKVRGYAVQRVQQLGNGYWSYYGAKKTLEEISYVGTLPETGGSVSAEW